MEILLRTGVSQVSYNRSSEAQEMGGKKKPGLVVQ